MKKTLVLVKPWPPEKDRTGALRLDLNENLYTPKKVIHSLRAFDDETINSYPHYYRLIEKLAVYAKVPKNWILPTNGASQGIVVAIQALFERDNKIVIPSPVFYPYYHFLKLEGVKIAPTYYQYDDAQKAWHFPLAETIRALKGAKGLILVNPNNPIGVAIPDEIVKTLLKKTAELGMYVIIDEAYIEFGGVSAQQYIRRYPKLIIIRTFSKFFGLTGLRLGYILAQPQMITELQKVKGPWDVNRFAVLAGVQMLAHMKEFIKIRSRIEHSRQELYCFFKQHNIDTWDSDTNFLVVRIKGATNIFTALMKKKIFISNLSGHPYSKDLFKHALRITIPIGDDLARLKKQFAKMV